MADVTGVGILNGETKKIDASNPLLLGGNVAIPDGGTIGSASDRDAITISAAGVVTFSVAPIINGTTTQIDTTNLTVADPLIKLASGNDAADSLDIGFYGLYDPSGSLDLYCGLFRDATDGKWKLFKDNQAEPDTTVSTSGTGYAVATLVANIEGDVTGDLTGNADTATSASTLTTGRDFDMTGDVTCSAETFAGGANITFTTVLDKTALTGQTALGASAVSGDYVLLSDTSDSGNLKKVTVANLVASSGTMNNFSLGADSGSGDTVDDGDTLTVSGTINQISTALSSGGTTITVSLDSTITWSNTVVTMSISDPASGSNVNGNNLNLKAQKSTGTGDGGAVRLFSSGNTQGTATTVNTERLGFQVDSDGAKVMHYLTQDTKLRTSTSTIAQYEFVGIDRAKGTSADNVIMGMQGGSEPADSTAVNIVLFANKQVIGGINTSSWTAEDRLYIANDGTITNSQVGLTNNLWQAGYAIDSASDGKIFLDVKHIMSL